MDTNLRIRVALCPNCKTGQRKYEFLAPFNCPNCGTELRVDHKYCTRFHIIIVVISLGAMWALWLQNFYLIFLTPIVPFFVGFIVFAVMKRTSPPPLIDVQADGKQARYRPL